MHPNYPCGEVHKNVWHFVAPAEFRGDLSKLYNGRLEFKMLAASHSGTARPPRGAVVVTSGSADAPMISYPMDGFAPPAEARFGNWTSYSVVFREDLGWRHEPTHQRVSLRELRAALDNVTGVLIRGDQWVYSREGYGQEVVYLNDIRMMLP